VFNPTLIQPKKQALLKILKVKIFEPIDFNFCKEFVIHFAAPPTLILKIVLLFKIAEKNPSSIKAT
jgi:hypothetical protein